MVFVGDIHRYGRLSEWFLLVISIVIVGEMNGFVGDIHRYSR
jgi:hypothetical protein